MQDQILLMRKFLLLSIAAIAIVLVGFAILLRPWQSQSQSSATALHSTAPASVSDNPTPGTFASGRAARIDSSPATADPLTRLLQALPAESTRISSGQQQAIAEQVDQQFAAFLANLAGDQNRIGTVRARFLLALSEIAAVQSALQSGDLDAQQLAVITDPNHLLNRVAELLDSSEQTALDNYIRESLERQFQQNYAPQVELLAPQLSEQSTALLLQTLYAEQSALANPYGIGPQTGLGAGLEGQLKAFANTRESLRSMLPLDQFQQADRFLTEQSQGLIMARGVFSGLR